MIKNIIKISLFSILFLVIFSNNVYAQEHSIFNQLLKDHVTDGVINYPELCNDQRLPEYTNQLSATDPDSYNTKDDELAFWINAYNANTLRVICKKYPIKSMNELNFGGLLVSVALKKTVWDRKFIKINGKKLSLKAIEHEIIRPKFLDPRSHLALACGASSCPPLNSMAYEGEDLDAQLTQQAEVFFNSVAYNSFDGVSKKAQLSTILDWNKSYFGKTQEQVLAFAMSFTPYKVDNLSEWNVTYNKYDLTLNDTK